MNVKGAELRTLFTDIGGTHLFITAESWIQVKLRLETAGPVAIGTRAEIQPVLGGQGALLGDEEMEIVLHKGDKLYYAAQAVNRVRVLIEPAPQVEADDEMVSAAPVAPPKPPRQPTTPPARPSRLGKPRWP